MASTGVIGSLVVRIAAEVRKYMADMDEAARSTEDASGRIDKAARAAGDALGGMGGGVADAAQAVRTLAGTTGPVGVALGVMAYAAYQGAKEHQALERALILSGNAAGVTSGQMAGMAASIDGVVGTQAKASETLAMLAQSGAVASGSLQHLAQVAIEVERGIGQSTEETVKIFAELGENPVKASKRLNEGLNYLTAATFEQIKAAQALGMEEAAASMAQEAYADAMQRRAAAVVGNLGLLERSWIRVKDVAKEAWDAMLSVGRASTPEERIGSLQRELAAMEAALAKGFGSTGSERIAAAETTRRVEALRAELAALQGATAGREADARAQAEWNRLQKDKIAFIEEGDKYLSKSEKLGQALAREALRDQKLVAAGLMTQAEMDTRLAQIREANAEKGARAVERRVGADAWATEVMRTYAATMQQLEGIELSASARADGLSKAQEALRKVQSGPEWAAFSRQMQEQIIMAAANAQAQEDAAEKTRQWAQEVREFDRATAEFTGRMNEVNRSVESYGQRLQESADRERFMLGLWGQTETARATAIKQYEIEADRLREVQRIQKSGLGGELEAQAIARVNAMAMVAAQEAAQVEVAKGWQSTFGSLSDGLVQALLDGGRSAAQRLKALFRSLVLEPVLRVGVNAVLGSAGAMLGLPGMAQASGLGGVVLAGGTSGGLASGLAAGWGSLFNEAGMLGGMDAGLTALTAGNVLGGVGTLLGAAAPVLAGVAALASIVGNSGETRSGGQYAWSSLEGTSLLAGPSGGEIDGANTRAAISSTAEGINALLKSLGSSVSLQSFQAGIESSENNRGGVFAGGTLSSGATFGQSGGGSNYDGTMYDPSKPFSGDASAMVAAFKQEMAQATLEALKAAEDIPKSIKDQLDEQDISSMSAEAAAALVQSIATQVAEINGFSAAMDALPFDSLKHLSYDAAAALGRVAGGLSGLAAGLTSFYHNTAFYSQAEQDARAMEMMQAEFASLGMTVPATTAEYRALVEATAAMAPASEAAALALARLLTDAQSFADIQSRSASQSPSAADSSEYWYFAASSASSGGPSASSRGDTNAYDRALQASVKSWSDASAALKASIDSLTKAMTEATDEQSFAQQRSAFAIALAQAQAGDAEAAAKLPDLARALQSSSAEHFASSVEQKVYMAQIIAAMQALLDARSAASSPAPGVGGLVLNDGRMSAWSSSTAAPNITSSSSVVDAIHAMSVKLDAIVGNTSRTARTLDAAAYGGQPLGMVAVS